MAKITTIEKLKLRSNGTARMPSIRRISKMLLIQNIQHTIEEYYNIVEPSGKNIKSFRLCINRTNIILDTSHRYYSFKSKKYARDIIEYLNKSKKI